MQGAGGVLVLGSVFPNIIERTHTEEREKKLYPEQWLKNCVRELHKIFESFDGSMLISMIVGLVDEATGFLYYINAEHPFMILYRDDHARFVDRELTFRKIGTTGMSGSIHVETFQLLEGDIILMGSDGKDDLRMQEADGTEYINEDERMILRLTDKTMKETPDLDHPDGQEILSRLVRHIEETGEVMDDLSLLMIRHGPVSAGEREQADESVMNSVYQASRLLRENRPVKARETLEEALEKAPHHREVLKLLVKLHVREKDFEECLEYLDTYIRDNPGDSEFLYLASYCSRKIDRYQEATELGERVRIREPNHVKNLINLSHSYFLAGNRERAGHILDEALEMEPENSIALRLKEKISKE
jgi:tetratricopeptide (TPR) repeat protein